MGRQSIGHRKHIHHVDTPYDEPRIDEFVSRQSSERSLHEGEISMIITTFLMTDELIVCTSCLR
jgi:hypothetical protein